MDFRKGRLVRQGSHNTTDLARVSEEDPPGIEGPSSMSRYIKSPLRSPSVKGTCILVMGLTGAGKSTFISQLTQHSVPIGHSLGSCTVDVYGYPFQSSSGDILWLIDTPGFDDTNKAHAKIVREIVSFLCTDCNHHRLCIGGLLYIHRITDIRMSSSSLKSLRIFEQLCGEASFSDVTIVTTMWDMLQTEEAIRAAEAREVVLRKRENFFGRLRVGGAGYERHENKRSSSLKIIEDIANREREVYLAVQIELGQNGRSMLADTTVGRYLEGDLRDTRRKYEIKMKQMEALSKNLDEGEDDMTVELNYQNELIKDTQLSIDYLSVTYEEMRREREAKIIEEGTSACDIDNSETKLSLGAHVTERRRITSQEPTRDREVFLRHRTTKKPEESPVRERTFKDRQKKESSPSPWMDFLHALFGASDDTLIHEKRRSSSVPLEMRESRHRDDKSNRQKRAPQSRERRRARKPSLQDSRQTADRDNDSSSLQQFDDYDEQHTAYNDEQRTLSESYMTCQTQQFLSSGSSMYLPTAPPIHSGYSSAVMVDPTPFRRSYARGLPYIRKPPEYTTTIGSVPRNEYSIE